MSRGEVVGFATVACVACCIGPILGVVGAIAALGVIATMFIGVAALAVTAAAVGTYVIVRRRRARSCAIDPDPVAVELTRSAL